MTIILGFITPPVLYSRTQELAIRSIIKRLEPTQIHHACKHGIDECIHSYARRNHIPIIGHPIKNKTWRMYIAQQEFDAIYEPMTDYNEHIHLCCNHIVGIPCSKWTKEIKLFLAASPKRTYRI